MDYQNQPYYCGGVRGQAGHGTAEGCSSLFTGSDDVCTNELHFYHNAGKPRTDISTDSRTPDGNKYKNFRAPWASRIFQF